MTPVQRPAFIQTLALLIVLLAAIAFSLTRVDMTDTPWHLATARQAFEGGRLMGDWPTTNLFSYTYPEHTLFQQYPLYQSLLYLTHHLLGFEGLSLLHCVLWLSALLLWIRWAGGWRWACHLHLLWMLVLLGLQRRMVLRPDVLTMPLLVCLLLLMERYRETKGRSRGSPAGFVVVQFLMANSHQIFTLGLIVQAAFLTHLALVRVRGGRSGISGEDRALPVLPPALAFAGSLLACLATPLGFRILTVPAITMDSLAKHRLRVQEFAPIWESPYELGLVAVAALVAAIGLLRVRASWQPFDLGIVLIGLLLAAAARRGAAFSVAMSGAVFARCLMRSRRDPVGGIKPRLRLVLLAALTLYLGGFVVLDRWVKPARGLVGAQPGVGKTLGQWPDQATAFLKRSPPPGRMLNLSWYAGNALIWELYPETKVFVDPRFEAYPREFLLRAIEAETDDDVVAALIEEYQPTWFVGELRLETVQERAAYLLRSGWRPVFLDTVFLVLVRETPETKDYLEAHRIDLARDRPAGILEGPPDIRLAQLLRLRDLYESLGLEEKRKRMLDEVERMVRDDPALRPR